MEPIQKLSSPMKDTSGISTAKTMPPAKMPTASFVSTYATSEISESTVRLTGENRRSRNSGMVKTFERM